MCLFYLSFNRSIYVLICLPITIGLLNGDRHDVSRTIFVIGEVCFLRYMWFTGTYGIIYVLSRDSEFLI